MSYEITGGGVERQNDFSGGMVSAFANVPQNAYRYGLNCEIRDGAWSVRRGIRRAFRGNVIEGFYFNQDNVRYNDATHTGFWFPFEFIGTSYGEVQGMGLYQFSVDTEPKLLTVSHGKVYKTVNGFSQQISTEEAIALTEEIEFIQAGQYVFMLRGDDNNILYWDGSPAGFILPPAATTGDEIPKAHTGCYAAGRLWLVNSESDVYASDILSFSDYDYTGQLFGVDAGDSDKILRLVPFHEDSILVFKGKSIHLMNNVNAYVAGGSTLAVNVVIQAVSREHGLLAKNAYVIYGEQVAFLDYNGIYNLQRTTEGKMQGLDVPLSIGIQDVVERINWLVADASAVICSHNYLLFSVPLEDATQPNAILAYDLLANGGQGAWAGIWKGLTTNASWFFNIRENCYFLGFDGFLRVMFSDDPWDSEDYLADLERFDNSKMYSVGAYVTYSGGAWVAVAECQNEYPGAGTSWASVPDVAAIYDIQAELWSRYFDLGDPALPKSWGKCEALFQHRNPTIEIKALAEDFSADTTLFQNITYDQVKYDVADTADWDPTNINGDFATPHRQDYSVFVEELPDGLYVDDVVGLALGVDETHTVRWIPWLVNRRRHSVGLKTSKGWLKLKHLTITGRHQGFAHADRA